MIRVIALFGATGGVGSELLQRLLSDGAQVRVLARDPSKLKPHPLLTIIPGNVLDYADVEQCIETTHTVYVCLGTRGNKATQLYSMGTENIIAAMKHHHIKRVICLSSAGVFGYDGGFFGRIIVPLTLWRPFRDKRKQAKILEASGLDWTLVRPTEIKPGKQPGQLVVSFYKMKSASISMTTLVDFLAHEEFNREHIGKMPIIGD
jgi:nucleoside-diphosphate-sugar epimerase